MSRSRRTASALLLAALSVPALLGVSSSTPAPAAPTAAHSWTAPDRAASTSGRAHSWRGAAVQPAKAHSWREPRAHSWRVEVLPARAHSWRAVTVLPAAAHSWSAPDLVRAL